MQLYNILVDAIHLRHNAVVVGASSVLEHYVWIVVDDKVVKSWIGAANTSFSRTTCTQRILGDIRHVLFEDKWRHCASTSPLS